MLRNRSFIPENTAESAAKKIAAQPISLDSLAEVVCDRTAPDYLLAEEGLCWGQNYLLHLD